MNTDNPFDGREYAGIVFRHRRDRNFFIGRWSPRQREEWLRDHPDDWQTREDFLRDQQARAGTDVEAEPPEARSAKPINKVQASSVSDGSLAARGEDKRLPDKPATNTTLPTIGNAEATATAGDEITVGERRFASERRVAAMLGYSRRQLQRWRKEGKGPPSTKIGRRVFYEINELQEWIIKEKSR